MRRPYRVTSLHDAAVLDMHDKVCVFVHVCGGIMTEQGQGVSILYGGGVVFVQLGSTWR